MSVLQTILLTALAMLAFASNSLLCRLALKLTSIDPASFTSIRLASGAFTLWLILRIRSGPVHTGGNWISAFALFVYAAAFSYAYVSLSAATGALLLFGAVQMSMIGVGLWRGERLSLQQTTGLACAIAGLGWLLLPGLAAPPALSAALMIGAGIAWGIYSLRGRTQGHGGGDATATTAGNFLRAVPIAVAMSLVMVTSASVDRAGSARR